jgi:CRISPR-associated endonuclease Cas1 subtype II
MNYVRKRTSSGTESVFIDEIDTLILESTAVNITAYLMQELIKHKVKVIICDDKHQPSAELLPYAGSFDAARKLRMQLEWDEDQKDLVWQAVIQRKILMQAHVLDALGNGAGAALDGFAQQCLPGDETNMEAQAARAYFTSLFGVGFNRRDPSTLVNSCLDYGYTILLSAVNRAIASTGYSTLLGIFHHGPENDFNLGSDLMEPLRPFIDRWVIEADFVAFDPLTKHRIVDFLNCQVEIANTKQYLGNAIEIYVRSVIKAIDSGSVSDIKYCDFV